MARFFAMLLPERSNFGLNELLALPLRQLKVLPVPINANEPVSLKGQTNGVPKLPATVEQDVPLVVGS